MMPQGKLIHKEFPVTSMRYFALFLLLISVISCGDSEAADVPVDTGVMSAQDVCNDNINRLITEGDASLAACAVQYSPDLTTAQGLQTIADYLLFPFETAEGKTFPERMKTVYWDEDNLLKVYRMQDRLSRGSTDPINPPQRTAAPLRRLFPGERWPTSSASGKPFYDDKIVRGSQKEYILKGLSAAAPLIGTIIGGPIGGMIGKGIGSLLGGLFKKPKGPSVEQRYLARINQQVDKISAEFAAFNSKFDTFSNQFEDYRRDFEIFALDMRNNFSVVDSKLNEVITGLGTLRSDVNILSASIMSGLDNILNLIMQNDYANAISSYKGFLSSYTTASSLQSAYLLSKQYYSTQYWTDIHKTSALSVNIQKALWPGFATYAEDDPSMSSAGKLSARVTTDKGTVVSYSFSYANPKKTFLISLGNIDFLMKMISSRLNIGSLSQLTDVDPDQAMTAMKADLASAAGEISTKILGETGIRQSIKDGLNQMASARAAHLDALYNYFPAIIPAGETVQRVELLKDGSVMADTQTGATLANLRDSIDEHYSILMLDYPMLLAGKLVSLEVILKSYM